MGQLFALLGMISFCLSQAVAIRKKAMILLCILTAFAGKKLEFLSNLWILYLYFTNLTNHCHLFLTNINEISINLSALLNVGSNLAFLIYANMVEYRFYHVSVSGIYEVIFRIYSYSF